VATFTPLTSRVPALLGTLALIALLTPVRSAAAASPEQLIERTSTWYAEQCSDPEKELFPSDESNGLLGALQASNEESGEPTLLAWHGLISICTGDREGGQANLDLFKAIAGDVEPALTARIDLELGLRDGQCRTATSAASRLAKEGKTADDWRAVLLARTHCKASCSEVIDAAEQLEGLGGDSSPFGWRVDACRTELAEEQSSAEERERLADQRAARRAELTPQFEAVRKDYDLVRKRAAPAKALVTITVVGGGSLIAVGSVFRVQSVAFSDAAARADSGPEYDEQVAFAEEANTRFVAFVGGGAALLTSGVVAAIVSGVQAKKNKALRERYKALRRELDDLEGEGGR
jgi:hypothetical protein